MCFAPIQIKNWLSLGTLSFFLLLMIFSDVTASFAQEAEAALADSSSRQEVTHWPEATSANLGENSETESIAGCTPPTAEGPSAIANTFGGSSKFFKPNQSKVFFHANKWWVAAPDNGENDWFLWKKKREHVEQSAQAEYRRLGGSRLSPRGGNEQALCFFLTQFRGQPAILALDLQF